jgi:hypothetical protein
MNPETGTGVSMESRCRRDARRVADVVKYLDQVE